MSVEVLHDDMHGVCYLVVFFLLITPSILSYSTFVFKFVLCWEVCSENINKNWIEIGLPLFKTRLT